jgi:N-acetylmuramoyl-L-alanine amidase
MATMAARRAGLRSVIRRACAALAGVGLALCACGVAALHAGARAQPLAGRVIVVNPGHNGHNYLAPQVIDRLVPAGRGRVKACDTAGTETDSGYTETAFNWDVALRLRALALAQGARVVLTRPNDTGVGPCVNERAELGNRAHADAVVSIHADGGPAAGRGFQVIYAPDSGPTAARFAESLRLARAVDTALTRSAVLPPSTYVGRDGYSIRDDLAGLNLSKRPAIFVELGNMRNATDAAILMSPAMRERLASALDAGLVSFLGVR